MKLARLALLLALASTACARTPGSLAPTTPVPPSAAQEMQRTSAFTGAQIAEQLHMLLLKAATAADLEPNAVMESWRGQLAPGTEPGTLTHRGQNAVWRYALSLSRPYADSSPMVFWSAFNAAGDQPPAECTFPTEPFARQLETAGYVRRAVLGKHTPRPDRFKLERGLTSATVTHYPASAAGQMSCVRSISVIVAKGA